MSGIVGIVHADGAPVDPELLRRLTEFLAFRGPDAHQVWLGSDVGFGHTLLRTTYESANERQPFSRDGQIWIVADARVDARPELRAKLRARCDEPFDEAATDVELILRAYAVWGEQCVDHLLGDFAFAIWDGPGQRLFCARDQMGVKPFFYAHLGSLFLFSNTLDCVRLHPAVSDRLNDLAIADFLLFDMNQDPATTSFADIQRLPPAHTLTWESASTTVRRYWSLSVTERVHFRREREYVERFLELLDTAVADRLRCDSVGVLMSGGLDSPTVTASARRVLTRQGNENGLRAYTQVFDQLIPHEERYYAGLVAEDLRIPIEFHANDDVKVFGNALHPDYHLPEPKHCAWPDPTSDLLRKISGHSRVVLTGFGADPAFSCRITLHFRSLLKSRRYRQALSDSARYLTTENRLSRLYLRTRLRLLLKPKGAAPSYPGWLNEDLATRLLLRNRWEAVGRAPNPTFAPRSEALEAVRHCFWLGLFEDYDTAFTNVPLEVRHPFFDLRLLDFLLALPVFPWCADKELLRIAAVGVFSDAVRLRRKSPLRSSPLVSLLKRSESAWVDRFEPLSKIETYVVPARVPKVFNDVDTWTTWIHLRPHSLNFWLRDLRPVAIKS